MIADASHVVVLFIADLGMMAFVAILFGETKRYDLNEAFRELTLGVLFGICAIYSIVSHQTFGEPGSVDAANIFVAFAGAFLSLIGGLTTLTFALAASLASDMPFHWSEHIDLVLALTVGVAWRMTKTPSQLAGIRSILLLGCLIGLTFVPFGAFLTGEAERGWVDRTVPSAIMALIATGILGGFIERERRLISTETLLRVDAHTDALTGIGNRRTLEQAFNAQYRTFPDHLHVLILADIDHFKTINDRHGHAVGDIVLRSTADLFRRVVRTGDVVARVGGEEFAVLLQAQSSTEAMAAANRLREQVAATPIRIGQASVSITISLGVHVWMGHRDFADVFELADTALYDAKRAGRNRVAAAQVILAAES